MENANTSVLKATSEDEFVMTGSQLWLAVKNVTIWIDRLDDGVDIRIYAAGQEMDSPLDLATALFSDGGIACPRCGCTEISVMQVVSEHNGRIYTGHWPLSPDGFVWDETGEFSNGSTCDEEAECDNCHLVGDLATFGFGL